MAKDWARGEQMMRQVSPIKADRQNDTSESGNSVMPSWQNRGYGWKALQSDKMPPIPDHFKTGSWMNRFGSGPSPQNEQGQTEEGQSGQSLLDKSDSKKQLIAFGDEWSITQDPLTGLFVLVFGGIVYAGQKTLEAANNLLQQVMKSTHDHGGGKNSQHGKSEDRPSDLRRLKELEEQLKNASGKEKKKIQTRINNLKKEMAARRKGENHSQKPKK